MQMQYATQLRCQVRRPHPPPTFSFPVFRGIHNSLLLQRLLLTAPLRANPRACWVCKAFFTAPKRQLRMHGKGERHEVRKKDGREWKRERDRREAERGGVGVGYSQVRLSRHFYAPPLNTLGHRTCARTHSHNSAYAKRTKNDATGNGYARLLLKIDRAVMHSIYLPYIHIQSVYIYINSRKSFDLFNVHSW